MVQSQRHPKLQDWSQHESLNLGRRQPTHKKLPNYPNWASNFPRPKLLFSTINFWKNDNILEKFKMFKVSRIRDGGNSSKRIFLKNIDFLVKTFFKDNYLQKNLYEDAASEEIFTLYTREEYNLGRIILKDFFKPV